MTHLAPEALRAARAILKWSTQDLARESGVAPMTINALENGRPYRVGTGDTLIAVFARHGVEILNGDAPGARMRPQS